MKLKIIYHFILQSYIYIYIYIYKLYKFISPKYINICKIVQRKKMKETETGLMEMELLLCSKRA